jgi:hypothetical protein
MFLNSINMKNLYFRVILSFSILILVSSCSNENKSDNGFNDADGRTSYFLENEEVELLINENEPIFLSYWVGMTKNEVTEVTRYLLEREMITGIVYDPYDDSTAMKYCSNFCLDATLEQNCSYVKFNPNNYYLLWQDNAQSLRVLLEHTQFEIKFNYSEIDGVNSLSSIFLEAVSEVTSCSGVNYSDFEGIVNLFNEKYGMPQSSYLKSEDEGSCSYRLENKEIELYYQSSHVSERFKNFNAPSQIHIEYYDKRRKQEEFEDRVNNIESQKLKNEEERKMLDEEVHTESLKKI